MLVRTSLVACEAKYSHFDFLLSTNFFKLESPQLLVSGFSRIPTIWLKYVYSVVWNWKHGNVFTNYCLRPVSSGDRKRITFLQPPLWHIISPKQKKRAQIIYLSQERVLLESVSHIILFILFFLIHKLVAVGLTELIRITPKRVGYSSWVMAWAPLKTRFQSLYKAFTLMRYYHLARSGQRTVLTVLTVRFLIKKLDTSTLHVRIRLVGSQNLSEFSTALICLVSWAIRIG